jgi:4-oxalocrotonate tautomerase
MPLVNVHMAAGRTPEQKKALMEAITAAVVDTLGAPIDNVRVWIDEFPAAHYMAAGELLADRQARLAAERQAAGDPELP